MRLTFYVLLSTLLLLSVFLALRNKPIEEKKEEPSDWFMMQRAYPYGKVDYGAYQHAVIAKSQMQEESAVRDYLQWELAGPINIGGRVQDIEADPANANVVYVGAASGGIFKSEDEGASWAPVFDGQPSESIGDIAIAPSNSQIIYAGTGEPNCGGGSVTYDGAGIFKSTDAGDTWNYTGLDSTRNTGKIVVDPQNPNRVFTATMGDLFSNTSDRGVYRTLDGGQNWERVLYLSDSTGAIDLAIHPQHPDTIYACMWERVRHVNYQRYYGTTSGIYRSYDGGDTWQHLTNGLPSGNVGRIGIDISQSNPNVLYCIVTQSSGSFGGVYKTTDGGDTWTATNDNALNTMFATYGWWFGRIKIDPTDDNIAFAVGFDTYRTSNGGNSWQFVTGTTHVDHHTIFIHPLNHLNVWLGNDGGAYHSSNGGNSWLHFTNLPNNQFYTAEINYSLPASVYGGLQDNGVVRTPTGNLNDWEGIIGGDGFYILVDPVNSNYQYGASQYGALEKSSNGGNSFNGATSGIPGSERKNWNAPIAFNPQHTQSLYFGAQKVYKTLNRANNWSAISPDLTNNVSGSNVTYSTITTIAASPVDSNIILAGTDDGNVWVTQNNGGNWTKVSDSLPNRWVTRVVCDPADTNVIYVTLSGYRFADNVSHVYRSNNLGQTWVSISGNLPDIPCNDLIVDPALDSTLYLATDVGVFASTTLGNNWYVLGYDLPTVPITDLAFHEPTRKLVAATYGRSMYAVDLSVFTMLQSVTSSDVFNVTVFPNPVFDQLTVTIESGKQGQCEAALFDLQGNLCWQSSKQLRPGKNSFLVSVNEIRNANSEGIYLLKITSQGKSVWKKIMML